MNPFVKIITQASSHAPVSVAALPSSPPRFCISHQCLSLAHTSFVICSGVFIALHYNELSCYLHRNTKGLPVNSASIHRKLLPCFFSFSLFFFFCISHNVSLSALQLYPLILPHHPSERSKLLRVNVSMTHKNSLFILFRGE